MDLPISAIIPTFAFENGKRLFQDNKDRFDFRFIISWLVSFFHRYRLLISIGLNIPRRDDGDFSLQ